MILTKSGWVKECVVDGVSAIVLAAGVWRPWNPPKRIQ